MRIAFYAPLKSPTHGTPSGDRRVAGLLMDALGRAGHQVELVSTFRSYDAAGDAARQAGLRDQGLSLGRRLAGQWRDGPAAARPDLWLTYHTYYKAPDWLGPEASRLLAIPYVIVEASHAGKRAGGPWDIGHRATAEAIGRAELLLCPTRDERPSGSSGCRRFSTRRRSSARPRGARNTARNSRGCMRSTPRCRGSRSWR